MIHPCFLPHRWNFDIWRNSSSSHGPGVYLIPPMVWYILLIYRPMYGVSFISFKSRYNWWCIPISPSPLLASFFDLTETHRPATGQEPTQWLQDFDTFFVWDIEDIAIFDFIQIIPKLIYPCFSPFLASFFDLGELITLSRARNLSNDSKVLIYSSKEVSHGFPVFCFIQIELELMMYPHFPPLLMCFFALGETHRPVMSQGLIRFLQGSDILF